MGSLHKFPKKGKAAATRSGGFAKLAQPFLDHDIPVFPVNELKRPLTEHGFKDAVTDRRKINEWAREFPKANVAIPTGPGTGFVVIDLDTKNGIDGIANFKKRCKELGVKIPATYAIRTPSGGKHLYFKSKHAGAIKNSTSTLAPGVDVRAQGGYVLAERSSIDGARYTCIDGNLDDIARLPKKLRDAMQTSKAKKQPGKSHDDSIAEGTRNSKLFRAACSLRAIGRNRRATLKLIRTINKGECKPPLGDDELENLVDSAFDNATSEITMRCAGEIKPMPLSPLWPGVLFRRKVCLLAGEPGLGKSLFACDVAARISRAKNWPGGEPAVIGRAATILISGEDDPDDTIVPRLISAGADLSKIHIISDIVETQGGELSALSIDQHMKSIHARMLNKKAALLVFDPVSAFMADRDSHRDTSVRALLNKIRQFAVEGNYAVLLISHFNKPGEKVSSAVHRVMGSLGFVAAARSVYAFVKDPQDSDKRMLLPIKNNLGPDTEGFRCRIRVDHKQKLVPRPVHLKWDSKPVAGTQIDDILSASPRAHATKMKKKKIKKWLHKAIKPGDQMASTKFNEKLKKKGFSSRMVRILMADFGYIKEKGDGFGAKWYVIRKS